MFQLTILHVILYFCNMLNGKKAAFYTLGCKLNFSETSTIGRQLTDIGFIKTDFNSTADLYVINTCSVTANANKECRRIIRKAKKNSPNAFIVVTGCYAQLKPEEIANIPGVDAVLGASEKFKAPTEVVGKIKSIKSYGIFVDVGEGLVGLLHVSEFPEDQNINELNNGGDITVTVTRVEEETRKVFLEL